MKTLIIIAGPNGAGKSTTSAAHLEQFGITAFDFDKEYYSKWAQFDFDPLVGPGVRESTAELFIELQQNAIKENKSFSFETNFNNVALLLPHIDRFREKGYQVDLIFLYLDSPERAIARVKQRVVVDKGHNVPEDQILERYRMGLEVLDIHFEKFDYITLFKSDDNDMHPLITFLPLEKQIAKEHRPMLEELNQKLPDLTAFIASMKAVLGKNKGLEI